MDSSKIHFFRPACVLGANGPDSREFLQGQFSNDLGKIQPNGCIYGLWLNRKGKIVADSFVLCDSDEAFRIISFHGSEKTIFERLDTFLVMDDVELGGLSQTSYGISVWGEAAKVVLEALGLETPEKGTWVGDSNVSAFWGTGEDVLEIIVSGDGADRRIDEIRTVASQANFEILSMDDMAAKAIVERSPRVGIEVGLDDLPQDVSLVESAVAFNKGCYLGQEVMARIQSMGKVRKRLASVIVDSPVSSESLPVSLFDAEGKKRGSLRSVVKFDSEYMGIAVVAMGPTAKLYVEETGVAVTVKDDGETLNER